MENRFLSSDERLLESGLFSDVMVKCGDTAWNLHKNILCSRSVWFNKALTGNYEESKTGVINISDFDPAAVGWVIRYIYTGVCDITALRDPTATTNFLICIQVYTVADYFAMQPLANIALDSLSAEFESKLASMQILHEIDPVWLAELVEAIRILYSDMSLPTGDPLAPDVSPIRSAFLLFAHAVRFALLQNEEFNQFMDSSSAGQLFALNLFRTMRSTGDFFALAPDEKCTLCKNKPRQTKNGDRGYFTHLAPRKLTIRTACQSCAVKKDLPPPTSNWRQKRTVQQGVPDENSEGGRD
ncbi:BTB/POZ protein [Rhypophila decipiens]|uniref:BTB/POZ protein n=1 Tax=Rhypophila decipiens TaxID=261697 RepID=A0AAN6XYM1_9PEZI|nr:BTB/POZ protein [Rhypophila decipiens]